MISIAMTTYNGELFLRKQLDSIFNQSNTDWELIVCDDASTDSTYDILKEYESKKTNMKVFRNDKNIGFKKNFEKAISLCSGEYNALCDQDDIWNENHLDILMNNLQEGIASFGNALIMDSNHKLSNDLLSERDNYYVDGNNEDKLYRILFYGNPFQGTSSLYKKKIFDYALPIPEQIEYHDAWFAAVSCCLNGLKFTPEIVTYYRIYGNNTSGSHKWNFFSQIFKSFKRQLWKTDRMVFCEELRNRIPNLSISIKEVIDQAYVFHKDRCDGKRLRTVSRIIKNYKRIYATDSYKYLFSRCVGILLRG